MESIGRAKRASVGRDVFMRVLGRWHVWLLTPLYVIFLNRVSTYSTLALWMKAKGYTVEQINVWPSEY